MSIKLKALGLGLLAAMAISAFAVMNASAKDGGHFVSENEHTILTGTESWPLTTHVTELAVEGLKGIVCTTPSYSGTVQTDKTKTVTSITITPVYEGCETTGDPKGSVTVTMNGCDYTFTVTSDDSQKTDSTVHVLCPPGKVIEIHHPSCTITVPPQTPAGGVSYSRETVNGKHAITLNSTVSGINLQFHGGICNLLGTTHPGTLNGSVTVSGKDTPGNPVGITATGTGGA